MSVEPERTEYAVVDEQTTPEGPGAGQGPGLGGPAEENDERSPGERISVGSGDEMVARIQLAARWAEAFAPDGADSLEESLKRFHRAYSYIDAVTHGVKPEEASPSSG